MIVLQVLNEVIVVVAWFSMRNGEPYVYGGPDPEPGSGPIVSNAAVLSFYLFTPFWALYFVMGAVLAFIYDTYKPGEKHNAYIWGYIADICTLVMLALTAVLIAQPENFTGEDKMFRPELANNSGTDTDSVYRLWSDISGRLCELTRVFLIDDGPCTHSLTFFCSLSGTPDYVVDFWTVNRRRVHS